MTPCAEPIPGAKAASPAAKSNVNLRSYGAASARAYWGSPSSSHVHSAGARSRASCTGGAPAEWTWERSEEHTSELQSQSNLVCRLLLEKKKHRATGDT